MPNKVKTHVSETFLVAAFLAFSGGFQDAYTYIVRDQVFANAQTGNIVLMTTHMMAGEFRIAIRYLYPILSFMIGIFLAHQIHHRIKGRTLLYWRQWIVITEILILFVVGFLGNDYYNLANVMVSFTCALQVQSFRKLHGRVFATTMCIGNLRSGTAALSSYVLTKDKKDIKSAGYYFGTILIFALGAGMGGNLSHYFGVKTIWMSCGILFVAFLLMLREPVGENKENIMEETK